MTNESCPLQESSRTGLIPAMILSVSLHLLAAWFLWLGSRETTRDCHLWPIVDTRVKEHGLEVCLALLDTPHSVPMAPPENTNAPDPIPEKKETSDLNDASNPSFGVAGAESSKPRLSQNPWHSPG